MRHTRLRDKSGIDDAGRSVDFVIFVASVFGRIVTVLRVPASHGWTNGVLREGAWRAKVVHQEHVELEDMVGHRVRELASQVDRGSFGRG